MDILTVGNENLPNVFVDRIVIQDSSNGVVELSVMCKMYDHRDNPSWWRRGMGIKVKCALVFNEETSILLSNGTKSLMDIPVIQNFSPTRELENEYSKVRDCDSFGALFLEGETLSEHKTNFTFSLTPNNKTSSHLSVYVGCFYEVVGTGSKLFNKFYGPISGELVKSGGQLNTESQYFYYPDTNEEYAGPVHVAQDGSYMAGSEHTSQEHPTVILVREENNKVLFENGDPSDSSFVLSDEVFAGTDLSSGGLTMAEGVFAREQQSGPTASLFTGSLDRVTEPDFNLVGDPVPNIPGIPQ